MTKIGKRYKLATDHRSLVLEAVATCPVAASAEQIVRDASSAEFTAKKVGSMVWQLRKEGLLQKKDDGTYSITQAGLDWLTFGRFDRALPKEHTRPGARRTKKEG